MYACKSVRLFFLASLALNVRCQLPFITDNDCGETYEGTKSGSIKSPGYPSKNYSPNLNCTYIITAPIGNVISYESVFMDIEDPDATSGECVFDVLKIYDGDKLWKDLCGVESIYLNATTTNRLKFVFVSDYSTEAGGFEIKWEVINLEQRAAKFNCDFDEPIPLCAGWTNEIDSYKWHFTRGFTPSANTGPVQDHTTKSSKGRYAYIEASKVPTNSTAILRSPQIVEAGTYCLTFWYHMFGRGVGGLGVQLIEDDGESSIVVVYNGDKGDVWLKSESTVRVKNPLATIAFEGRRGDNYMSDISIDDISLRKRRCAANVANKEVKEVEVLSRDLVISLPNFTSIPLVPNDCPPGMEVSKCNTDCMLSCDIIGGTSGPVSCFPACIGGCACPQDTPLLHDFRCIDISSCPRKPTNTSRAITATIPQVSTATRTDVSTSTTNPTTAAATSKTPQTSRAVQTATSKSTTSTKRVATTSTTPRTSSTVKTSTSKSTTSTRKIKATSKTPQTSRAVATSKNTTSTKRVTTTSTTKTSKAVETPTSASTTSTKKITSKGPHTSKAVKTSKGTTSTNRLTVTSTSPKTTTTSDQITTQGSPTTTQPVTSDNDSDSEIRKITEETTPKAPRNDVFDFLAKKIADAIRRVLAASRNKDKNPV